MTLQVSFSCFRYRQWEVSHRNWHFCFCREPLGSAAAINDGGSLAGVELHLAKDRASPAAGGVQILTFPGTVYGLVGGMVRGWFVEGARDIAGKGGEEKQCRVRVLFQTNLT